MYWTASQPLHIFTEILKKIACKPFLVKVHPSTKPIWQHKEHLDFNYKMKRKFWCFSSQLSNSISIQSVLTHYLLKFTSNHVPFLFFWHMMRWHENWLKLTIGNFPTPSATHFSRWSLTQMAFFLCNIIPIPCQGGHGGCSNQPVQSLSTLESNSNQVRFEFLHFKSGHGDWW